MNQWDNNDPKDWESSNEEFKSESTEGKDISWANPDFIADCVEKGYSNVALNIRVMEVNRCVEKGNPENIITIRDEVSKYNYEECNALLKLLNFYLFLFKAHSILEFNIHTEDHIDHYGRCSSYKKLVLNNLIHITELNG